MSTARLLRRGGWGGAQFPSPTPEYLLRSMRAWRSRWASEFTRQLKVSSQREYSTFAMEKNEGGEVKDGCQATRRVFD